MSWIKILFSVLSCHLYLYSIIKIKVDYKNEKTHRLHRLRVTKLHTWTIPVTVCTVRRPYFKHTAPFLGRWMPRLHTLLIDCSLSLYHWLGTCFVTISTNVDAFYPQPLMQRQSCSEFLRTRVQITGREYQWSWHTRSSNMTLPPGKWYENSVGWYKDAVVTFDRIV